MKLRNACLVLGLALASSNLTADIKSDIADGLDIQKVVANATEQGMKYGSIIISIANINPQLLTTVVSILIKTNPKKASEITVAAINAAPQHAQLIVDSAIKQVPSQSNRIIAALIAAGHDPLTLTQASASNAVSGTSPMPNKQTNVTMPPGKGIGIGGGNGIGGGAGGGNGGNNSGGSGGGVGNGIGIGIGVGGGNGGGSGGGGNGASPN